MLGKDKAIFVIVIIGLFLGFGRCGVVKPRPNDEVKLIVEITRHGTRNAGVNIEKNSTFFDKFEPLELTDVGIRQRYYLGKNTYQRFKELFDSSKPYMKHNEFTVISSDTNRTLESAQAHIFGILGRFNGEGLPITDKNDTRLFPVMEAKFDPYEEDFKTALPLGIRAFGVHGRNSKYDQLFNIYDSCPKWKKEAWDMNDKEEAEVSKSAKFQEYVKGLMKLYEISDDWFSKENWARKATIIADYTQQAYYNSKEPRISPLDDKTKDLFTKSKNYLKTVRTQVFHKNDELAKKYITPFMKQILEKFQKKKENGAKEKMKYMLFSGHDTTLAPILTIAKLLDADCLQKEVMNGLPSTEEVCGVPHPVVASNIIYELIQRKTDQKWRVKFSYNNVYYKICTNSVKDEYDQYYCEFDEFVNTIEENYLTKVNLTEYCDWDRFKGKEVDTEKFTSLEKKLWFVILACGFIFLVEIVVLLKHKKNKLKKLEEEDDQGDDAYESLEV